MKIFQSLILVSAVLAQGKGKGGKGGKSKGSAQKGGKGRKGQRGRLQGPLSYKERDKISSLESEIRDCRFEAN